MDAANEAINEAEAKSPAHDSPEWRRAERLRLEAAQAVEAFISALLNEAGARDVAQNDPTRPADVA
jgi:hypothetical protein